MKNLLYVLLTLFLFSCSEKRVTMDELSKTGGYFYLNGKKFTGIGFEMYNSKQLKQEIHFKNGEKNGVEKLFSENGDLLSLKTYKNDVLNGPFEEYYQSFDGSKKGPVILKDKGIYNNDEKDGEFIECIDCEYDVSSTDDNFKIEKLYVKGVYKSGIRFGKFQYYTNSNPNFSIVTYDEKGKVIDGTEINSSNYWEEQFLESRKIK